MTIVEHELVREGDDCGPPCSNCGGEMEKQMTPEDADRLREWVDQMTVEQSALLWRWVFFAHLDKCEKERKASYDAKNRV